MHVSECYYIICHMLHEYFILFIFINLATTFPTWNMEFSGHPTWKYRYNIFCIICEIVHVAAAANSLQSCLTLWDPVDGSPPGSFVPGILQARTLEWVAISFSSSWKWNVKVKSLSCVQLVVHDRVVKIWRQILWQEIRKCLFHISKYGHRLFSHEIWNFSVFI